MAHTFTFNDEELYTLKYSISQRIYRCESLLDEAKLLTPDDCVKINNLSEVLFNLESIYLKLASESEGGEADEK